MDLILWRHAHAGDPWDDPEEDLLRPLSAKGERQAVRMASWLDQHLPDTTRVLVSPALRAQQTARALQRSFKTVDALSPDGTVDALLRAARYPVSREAVLIVGHQPTLGRVVSHLMDAADHPQPWSVRKGAVCWLRTREREGRVQLTLHALMGPDLV